VDCRAFRSRECLRGIVFDVHILFTVRGGEGGSLADNGWASGRGGWTGLAFDSRKKALRL